MNWAKDDAASFGEGVWRCTHSDCRAPVHIELMDTLIIIRCGMRHVQSIHLTLPEEFCSA